MKVQGRPQKFFQRGQSRHFAYPFQVSDDASQMDVHKTLYPFYITKKLLNVTATLANSAPSKTAMSTRDPVEGFGRPSRLFAVVKVSCILTTCPCLNNLEFDIFDAGGPQCHFITSVTIAVRIRTLSVY